jgi:hypothetical protein
MSGWEQVAGSSENDPLTLAESGEQQQWSFHGHLFDFECRLALHHYPMIPNGVRLEMRMAETGGGDPVSPIESSLVVIQGGQGAEVATDFDQWARIAIGAKDRELFAYAGKRVMALEELERMSTPDGPPGDE